MSHTLTRREALAAAGAVALAGLASHAQETDMETPWIDAHSHIWTPDVERFPLASGKTKADLAPLSFTDDELMAVARPERVGRVVLIQHSVYHLFDNSYLIDAVRRHPKRFRIVGMVDDHAAKPGEAMQRLLPQGITGFRITPFIRQQKPEAWLDGDGMHEMWRTGAKTRQAMCCLINPQDLPGVDAMCQEHPETPVVIDHFARIGIDGQFHDADLDNLCRLARHKHTSVKISAYYALGKKKPPHLELAPMIRRLLEVFGRERLMWASDSPYQISGENTYASSISLIRDRLDFLTPADKDWLLRKTAERVFFFA